MTPGSLYEYTRSSRGSVHIYIVLGLGVKYDKMTTHSGLYDGYCCVFFEPECDLCHWKCELGFTKRAL